VTGGHFLLDRVHFRGGTDAFDGNNFAAGEEADGNEATVDSAVGGAALGIAIDEDDGTGAAITLGATFFGAGQATAAQKFQQGGVWRNVIDTDRFAI
jgi:hypothetical protein